MERVGLRQYSELAMQKNLKVFMRQNKLVVHGKKWTLEELEKDPTNSFLNKPKRPREDDPTLQTNAAKKILGGKTLTPSKLNTAINTIPKQNPIIPMDTETNLPKQ
uniref:Uncharacterized protein n=1 Tax=Cacopsylla melanoneura TaxID=428564 RepID=A0A8D8XEY8_9HEMI